MSAPRPIMFCLILAAAVTSAQAQEQHRSTRSGDTVNVVVHKVRADRRAEYDSLMRTVWWSAMKDASRKHRAYARYAAERRRYVPTEMSADSTYTYVYLYFGNVELPEPKDGGNRVLRLAGRSKEQSDSFAQAIRAYTTSVSGGMLIDEPYR